MTGSKDPETDPEETASASVRDEAGGQGEDTASVGGRDAGSQGEAGGQDADGRDAEATSAGEETASADGRDADTESVGSQDADVRDEKIESVRDENTANADGRDIDERWEEIVGELSDLSDPAVLPALPDPLSGADLQDLDEELVDDPRIVATISSRAFGPRDWTPDEEDEDESFDEDLVTLMPADEDAPAAPFTKVAWAASALCLLLAALSAFGIVGNPGVALGAGAVGFILAAAAAFSSAPRAEDVDPFDDGARL